MTGSVGYALTIDVSGGMGGQGQSGGHGLDGDNGKAGSQSDIDKQLESVITQQKAQGRWLTTWFFTSNDAKEITLRSGEYAKAGGNSGAGGKGGHGGRTGSIQFSEYVHGRFSFISMNPTISYLEFNGQDGIDGESGTEGKGGKNQAIFEGKYIKKERNNWGLLGRIVVDAAAGAATGAAVGFKAAPAAAAVGSVATPVGSAAAAGTTIITGAIIGGITGALTPIIGSEIIDTSYWEKKADKLDYEDSAPSGNKAECCNEKGRENSARKPSLNYDDINNFWRGYSQEY